MVLKSLSIWLEVAFLGDLNGVAVKNTVVSRRFYLIFYAAVVVIIIPGISASFELSYYRSLVVLTFSLSVSNSSEQLLSVIDFSNYVSNFLLPFFDLY